MIARKLDTHRGIARARPSLRSLRPQRALDTGYVGTMTAPPEELEEGTFRVKGDYVSQDAEESKFFEQAGLGDAKRRGGDLIACESRSKQEPRYSCATELETHTQSTCHIYRASLPTRACGTANRTSCSSLVRQISVSFRSAAPYI